MLHQLIAAKLCKFTKLLKQQIPLLQLYRNVATTNISWLHGRYTSHSTHHWQWHSVKYHQHTQPHHHLLSGGSWYTLYRQTKSDTYKCLPPSSKVNKLPYFTISLNMIEASLHEDGSSFGCGYLFNFGVWKVLRLTSFCNTLIPNTVAPVDCETIVA